MDKEFYCNKCEETKPCQTEGGTGYGITEYNTKVCYKCCADIDLEYMIEHKRITLYLSEKDGQWYISNWPGTLKFKAYVNFGRHNIARIRRHAYFNVNGKAWYGDQYGDFSELCHCKEYKN